MKFIFYIFLIALMSSFAPCDNVSSKTDKFNKTTTKKTIAPLTLENSRYKFVFHVEWLTSYYKITGHGYKKSNNGDASFGVNSGLHFLFENGDSKKYFNMALANGNERVSNNIGLIEIPLVFVNYKPDNQEVIQKIVDNFKNNSISSIRVMGVGDEYSIPEDIDFDLTPSQKTFIQNAFQCMESTPK